MVNKSKRKLIFLGIGLFLAFVSLIFQFLFQKSFVSHIFVPIIPFLISVLPFIGEYLESSIEERKKKKIEENACNEIKNYLQRLFQFPLHNPPISEENMSKEKIYEIFIKSNFRDIDNVAIKSILLCFYCDMWERSRSPDLYGEMQKYSNSIGLSFAKLTDDTKIFLDIYLAFRDKNTKYNSLNDIIRLEKSESEYLRTLNDFAKRYVKDLSFFEIKDKLNQSENLRYTLVRIIKEGKLSKWGISNETLKQLEKELNYSKAYLVIGNKIGQKIKEYFNSQPGLIFTRPTSQNIPQGKKYFSGAIIKPKEGFDEAKKVINKLKYLSEEEKETILFVIPLDFINYEKYVFPDNQSFTSSDLKECYEAINWFRTGFEYSDTDLWNVISSSNITPEELLAIVPFNIFCEGILPCEQEFMIKNYSYIKERCRIDKLADWKEIDSEVISDYLLESGYPSYNTVEIKRVLCVESNEDFGAGVRKRFSGLCKQIVQNSAKFSEALSLMLVNGGERE